MDKFLMVSQAYVEKIGKLWNKLDLFSIPLVPRLKEIMDINVLYLPILPPYGSGRYSTFNFFN
jgi:hypothetical protein